MSKSTRNVFTTIRTEGAMLPPNLLQMIAEGSSDLEGLRAEDYHYGGERLNEVISRAWNAVTSAWASFEHARENLPEDDPGTTITRKRWLLPLFRELDYGRLRTERTDKINGKGYPISHRWENVPIHLMGCNVPLDRRTLGLPGAAQASPYSLLQVYLNRQDDYLWGFLSNGRQLRVLRDNVSLTRQAYVEFDLEAMMTGEVYADFVLLWLLCHRSRVEAERPSDFWLEKWVHTAQQQGTRALKHLRDGVHEAIEHLGAGFIAHPANGDLRQRLQMGSLDQQDYYRQLLYVVYRLLFLFAAEDRDLLFHPDADQIARDRYAYYSTRRLRDLAERLRATRHHDLFEGLRLVMGLLGGETALIPGPSPSGRRESQPEYTADPPERFREMASQVMVEVARELRQRQTDAEAMLWECLRGRCLGGLKFRRQHPVAQTRYVVDFFCYEANLIVELDGPIHDQQRGADANRQRDLEELGYRVIRFTNNQASADLEDVLTAIFVATEAPLPEGEAGVRALGLPVLGSFLFSREAVVDIIDCQIANYDLLAAIRVLAYVEDQTVRTLRPVDYKNLGSEELGSVYESLLELHPVIDLDARTFTLDTTSGHERKTTGSYYTPSSLINALLDSALDPVIEAALTPPVPSPEGRGEPFDREAALLDLKICDPACGSGHFLIAAAHRLARKVASVRTGEDEPTPDATRAALHDVIDGCIYGVDINPMAVELCKVNLWMEALEPGKPLSFLDHRILCGNSLLGTTPRLMTDGIPDDAFKPIEGDDKKVVSALRKQNHQERKSRDTDQKNFFGLTDRPAGYARQGSDIDMPDSLDDATLDGIWAKEARYRQLANDPEYIKSRLLADAWCAAFVWEKKSDAVPPLTDLSYRRLEEQPLAANMADVRQQVARLADQYQFFHWHVAFPDVFSVPDDLDSAENEQTGWNGGFDCVLGNPPWERIKLQEREWFAERSPEIASAPNAAVRCKLIKTLKDTDAKLLQMFLLDKRQAEGTTHFVRMSGYFPLTALGDVNTYALFTGLSRKLNNKFGFIGLIVPLGIATDFYMQHLFNDLMATKTLVELVGFENEEFLFPGVANVVRFCNLVLCGNAQISEQASFGFYLRRVDQFNEYLRFFNLTLEDIKLLNPNTKNCPSFRNQIDANLTKQIYRLLPIIVNEGAMGNPWNVSFLGMFHMANDSNLFIDNQEKDTLPLYVPKLFWHFDHRFASYAMKGKLKGKGGRGLPTQLLDNYKNPFYQIQPEYWVSKDEVSARIPKTWEHSWFIAYRGITSAKLERSVISAIIPKAGLGNNSPAILIERIDPRLVCVFVANLNSLVFDYVTRQTLGGNYLNYYVLKQIPIIPPHTYNSTLIEFVIPRVLELTYTAWDMQPFAKDIGYEAQPFVWDEERRFLIRCELDALFFHLYGLNREDTNFVLDPIDIYGKNFPGETFRVLKEKELAVYGEYRTKRVILEMYDQMAALPTVNVPAPKNPSQPYTVPDVSQFQAWLSPPPADPSVAHSLREDHVHETG